MNHRFQDVGIGVHQRRGGAESRVVHEQGDAGVRPKSLLDANQIGLVGEIGGQDLRFAARVGRKLSRQAGESNPIACDKIK